MDSTISIWRLESISSVGAFHSISKLNSRAALIAPA
jgi:hypothetical protein